MEHDNIFTIRLSNAVEGLRLDMRGTLGQSASSGEFVPVFASEVVRVERDNPNGAFIIARPAGTTVEVAVEVSDAVVDILG